MRQFSTIILSIFLFFILTSPAECAYKGVISYSIPIEYKNLSESELKEEADKYFNMVQQSSAGEFSAETTRALLAYSVLQHINPQNPEYSIKAGILYDKIQKDRQAKGCFSRAISISSGAFEPYFYMGEFYYKRGQYKQALKYYNKALENLITPNYDLYYKLGDIYEKFGDTKKALEYLNMAKSQNPNEELESKIRLIEAVDSANKLYYRQ